MGSGDIHVFSVAEDSHGKPLCETKSASVGLFDLDTPVLKAQVANRICSKCAELSVHFKS